MRVQKNCVVHLRYRMQNSKGEVLENIMNGPAIIYLHGEGKILLGLEKELIDLETGEKKCIQVKKADYPGLDDDFMLEVIIDNVRTASTDELKHGMAKSAGLEPCGDDCSCYKAD